MGKANNEAVSLSELLLWCLDHHEAPPAEAIAHTVNNFIFDIMEQLPERFSGTLDETRILQ